MIALGAGCGDSGSVRQRPTTTAATTTRSQSPAARRYVRDYKRLNADVRGLRAEAATVKGTSLLGTPALQRKTGRFIDDLQDSILTPKQRNRMIDHAAGAVATSCEQCFQMLEATRPIPQIAGH